MIMFIFNFNLVLKSNFLTWRPSGLAFPCISLVKRCIPLQSSETIHLRLDDFVANSLREENGVKCLIISCSEKVTSSFLSVLMMGSNIRIRLIYPVPVQVSGSLSGSKFWVRFKYPAPISCSGGNSRFRFKFFKNVHLVRVCKS
jgi:hypothetical protein